MSSECLFWAVKTTVGNAQRKLILIALCDISNEKMECYPSHEYLSKVAECSRSSVIRHLKKLNDDGLIEIENRSNGNIKLSNVYKINAVNGKQFPDVSLWQGGGVTVTHNTLTTSKHIDIGNWADWVKYRKERNKPLTPTTIKRHLAFLDQFDDATKVAIIEQSIERGWSGLFEVKHETTKPSDSGYRAGSAAAAAQKLRAKIQSGS